jgi:hypothetical protein
MIKRKFLLLTLVAAFSIFCGYAQDADEWDYPVKPGSEVWKSFTTYEQKADALQIPDIVLKKMSTKHLAEVCVNYPMMGDWFFFDDPNVFINNLAQKFNGLCELTERSSCAEELISIFMDYKLDNNKIVNN